MQSTNSQKIILSNLKRKIVGDSKNVIPSKKARSYCPQLFSIPDSVIYYITKNPATLKLYKSIVKTCKYFFAKNPILIIPLLQAWHNSGNEKDKKQEWKISFNENSVDFDKISAAKLWITDGIEVQNEIENRSDPFFSSTILPKIYQCDITSFEINNQNLSFKDFCFITSNVGQIPHLEGLTIKYDNGKVVPLEKILEVFPELSEFHWDIMGTPNIITSETVKELLKFQNFGNIDFFDLTDVPEIFDIESFYAHIKKNKNTFIGIAFCDDISQEYKNRLQAIVNEILQTENREYTMPLIEFPGNDELSRNEMLTIYLAEIRECF
uniref:Uncharacterized protein n=1 Tax=Panagrolaimus sp. ES5 TaxID=591445 RepID=A0AC34G2K4_9BILA